MASGEVHFIYESDDVAWEAWMRSYRFGVILISPPQPLRSIVNDLRATHDPKSQAVCDAHISITMPLARAVSAEDWDELLALAATLDPIEVQYGPLKHYLPHPGVCLEIAPQGRLDRIRTTIERADVFRQSPARKHPYSAHMTIAEFITAERTLKLIDELASSIPTGQFICDRLSYVVPDASFRFRDQGQLTLRGYERIGKLGSEV